ncbi:alpha-xenorhabdolysin family binary toxin subunit A [Moritella sp. 28]|uniref:alpha-xenorhabdolysin family binary toxin subunit A n=1 Tax=Moritella sp. 28 TaxID=2746232 RepID=UPI001BA4E193|nr:alpha-xenorhabdolysin family binary toxin subunit A [Moritella sp. 28]QUM86230.1 alpha-xenorhabdolysin family binary toxin subunit A [Moritella sp. 28]
MKKLQIINQKVIKSGFALSLIGASILLPAQAEVIVEPVDYDTVIGVNGQFIDLDSGKFLLYQEEWFKIQSYVEEALRLPITKISMINAFGIPKDVSFNTFQALLDEYIKVNATADSWNRKIYPNMVSLALKLSNYADVHSLFMVPLVNSLAAMQDAVDNKNYVEAENKRAVAIALLNILKSYAETRQTDTEQAEEDLLDFAAKIAMQSGQLNTLRSTHAEYLEDDGSDLKQQISEIQTRVEQLNAEYDKYVTIASTTVTYAWVPFYGIFAAVPVAGIYGDKAERARKERNQLKDDIKTLQEKLSYREKIYISYQESYNNMINIENKIRVAIPHVSKLKGHWQGINADFNTMLDLISSTEGPNGLGNATALVASLTANASVGQIQIEWQEISDKAAKFAQNAYIVVGDEPL